MFNRSQYLFLFTFSRFLYFCFTARPLTVGIVVICARNINKHECLPFLIFFFVLFLCEIFLELQWRHAVDHATHEYDNNKMLMDINRRVRAKQLSAEVER